MSLINDALKKAQNRHGDSTPQTPGVSGPASIPSAPRKGKTPFGKIVLVCAGIALLSGAVSTTVILLVVHKEDPAPLPTAPVAPVVHPAQTVIVATPVSTTPVAPSATSPITPAVVEIPPHPSPAIPVPPVAPAVLPEPAPTIKLGTRIQSFVDRLRVTSIRVSDTGNKAIINDRLFRVNDLVEPSLGLRLTDIQPSQLTFTDESGNTYLRHF